MSSSDSRATPNIPPARYCDVDSSTSLVALFVAVTKAQKRVLAL